MSAYRRKISILALLCMSSMMSLLSLGAYAAGSIVPHEATYKLRIGWLSGQMSTVVAETEGGFVATSVIRPTGFARLLMRGHIEEKSEFGADDISVRPMVYSSSDTLSKKDKFMNFAFDWVNDIATGEINDEEFVFEFDGEVRDRVSLQYQLMHDLLNGIPGTAYAMLDGDQIKQLQITNIGAKIVKTPFGQFEAVGIQHQARNSTRVSTLWCASELGYLPVLIEQHRKGKRRVRAILTNFVTSEDKPSRERLIPASQETGSQ